MKSGRVTPASFIEAKSIDTKSHIKEIQMIKLARIALFAAACTLLPLSASAAQATKADAEGMVQTAAAFATKNGEDKLVAEVNKKDGPFNQGDLYVVIFDKTGTVL